MPWPILGKKGKCKIPPLPPISLAFKKAIIYHKGLSYKKDVRGKILTVQIKRKNIMWLL